MSGNESEAGKPSGVNPEELNRLLELELIQKRAEWQRASGRHKNLRSASFFFLFVIVMAALVGGYFAFMRASEERQHRPASASAEAATP